MVGTNPDRILEKNFRICSIDQYSQTSNGDVFGDCVSASYWSIGRGLQITMIRLLVLLKMVGTMR